MCGICGKLALHPEGVVSSQLIRDMARMMAHRGPDDEGFYTNGRVGLGQRRLSIIDVAGGKQPIGNEDGTVWIVFNGEVYNHAEVRPGLEAKGHVYRTRTDTETILHAYEECGTECVKLLRGMFAFVIWDDKRQCLFAARDRFGIKPFYYWVNADHFAFASEMKALLIDPDIDVTLDPVAIYDYFTFMSIPSPRTPFREIQRLPQAHWLEVRDSQIRCERYWHPQFQGISHKSRQEHLEALESLMSNSIREHLMSEVPQGVFLSGGVDSSLIAALMSRLVNEPLRTFSIGFEEDRAYDESGFARQVAQKYGTQHHLFYCRPQSVDHLPDILWHIEHPLADASMIPLYELCHQANKEVTVVHCGEGGDEGFGGYGRFFWDRYAEAYGRVPESLRQNVAAPLCRLLQHLPEPVKELGRRGEKFSRFAGLPNCQRYASWFALIDEQTKHQLLTREFLEEVGRHRSWEVYERIFADAARLGLDALGEKQYCELHHFIPDDLMLKSDKVAMSASLEGRYPFLDHRLVEFGLALPPEHKIRGRQLKALLKDLLAKHMPPEFVYRGKQGFEVPVARWFRTSLDATLRETIAKGRAARTGILNTDYLAEMVRRLHRGDPAVGRQLFVVFTFLQWQNVFERPKTVCLDYLRTARPSGPAASAQLRAPATES